MAINNTWWLPKQKKYLKETKEWWCFSCQKITALKRNPDWSGEFLGEISAPDWFVRCSECGYKHYQDNGYECPDCGWDNPHEIPPIHCGELVYSTWASMEFGGSPYDWDETYLCPNCKKEFTIENSNY